MSTGPSSDRREERILILAPSRQDAPTVAAILQKAGLAPEIHSTLAGFCRALDDGAGAVLVAEEAVSLAHNEHMLRTCLTRQPPWSEPPVVLVTAGTARTGAGRVTEGLAGLGNVTLLERPLRAATLVSTMRSALRARRRQYQVRDHLRERERIEEQLRAQEQALRRLNESLEQRVRERTAELEASNRKLAMEIEQRQRAERALRHAQKMEAVGQLTGGIAHDFNNLLMVVSGGLDLLGRTADPARRDRIVGGMRQATARGTALTRQLLAFSRRMALSPEALDFRTQIDAIRDLVTGALRENIAIDIAIADDLWPLMADPTELELAILNTAVNARDAMPDGGTLTIEARNASFAADDGSGLSGEFVRIKIRDNGTGIPAENLDRIFDPFFTTKPVGHGTGLGLSQVYGFAKQSGGHVEVRSSLGAGTSIILHLPRAHLTRAALPAATQRQQLPPPQEQAAPAEEERRKVLLVEDNEDVAMLTTEMLEGLGFSVSHAASAPAALSQLENGHGFDLVFSDIVLAGGMNGIELVRELKRRRPNLPVVLATGYSEALLGKEAVEGSALLRKPYTMDALEAALKSAFRP